MAKTGQGYADMMSFNTLDVAALTPLRDGPLPRCIIKGGKEAASLNPHNSLVHSKARHDNRIQPAPKPRRLVLLAPRPEPSQSPVRLFVGGKPLLMTYL